MIQKQPGGEAKAAQQLHGLDGYGGALQAERGARPFAEQALMFGAQRARAAVGTKRHQAEEGVQVVTAECADVAAHAQVALDQKGLGRERRDQCDGHRRNGGGGGSRVQPDDAGRGHEQLEDGAQQLAA